MSDSSNNERASGRRGIPIQPPPLTREQIEADVFADFMALRASGHSLKALIEADLQAHEWICDLIEQEHTSQPKGEN